LKAVPEVKVVQHREEVEKDDDKQGAKRINDAQRYRGRWRSSAKQGLSNACGRENHKWTI
jgi:hypothetical protein